MIINILICEDEKKYLQLTKKHLEEYCNSVNQECNFFTYDNEEIPDDILKATDIACLDIDLHGKHSGIDIARKINQLNRWAAIIFISNTKQYKDVAFKLHVYGYLEKPINMIELQILLERAFLCVSSRKRTGGILTFFSKKYEIEIPQDSIIYIEKVDRKVKVSTFQQDYDINATLITIEKKLNKNFLRIDKGIIVNMMEISHIHGYNIYMTTGDEFQIARERRPSVVSTYQKYAKEAIV